MKCDHLAVGILAWNEKGELLMIQRRKEPYGIAPPAGHLDGDSYPKACVKELREETGLTVVGAPKPMVISQGGYRPGKCRRNGQYHYWQVFKVEWAGELKLSKEETLGGGWLSKSKLEYLAGITEKYRDGKMTERQWQCCPGLEPVWYDFLKEFGII
jgi:8-oxo-dGTP pyrophosphatase MutT (NUDIX family)